VIEILNRVVIGMGAEHAMVNAFAALTSAPMPPSSVSAPARPVSVFLPELQDSILASTFPVA
jgi:hypothetical protein